MLVRERCNVRMHPTLTLTLTLSLTLTLTCTSPSGETNQGERDAIR